ncbi:MAG: NAD-dependent epimerase/dehydratase family protein [Candidatus Zhuqueibacterota bacterium]
MKVGIIGAGEIAQYHIPYIQELEQVEVCAVCDSNAERASQLAKRFRVARSYASATAMLDCESPDVVHILTPPKTHAHLAGEAMMRGCHVLVEKPMAMNEAEAVDMLRAAEQNRVRLSVCHVYLYDPMFLRLMAYIESGQLGEIIHVEGYWFNNPNFDGSNAYSLRDHSTGWAYQLPGGVFANFLDHPIYLQSALLKGINGVSVATKKVGDNPFVQYDELRIQFEGQQASGAIVASLNIKPNINLIRVYGTKMIVTADMTHMTLTTQQSKNLPHMVMKLYNNFTGSRQVFSDTLKNSMQIVTGKVKPRQGLRTFLRRFYESLANNSEMPVSPEDGLENVRLCQSIWRKADEDFQRRASIGATKPSSASSVAAQQKSWVLVTGADGFLGRNLVKRLLSMQKNVKVLIRRINRDYLNEPNVEVIYGDIRDKELVRRSMIGVDTAFHLAGKVTNRGAWQDFQEVNIEATRNLLDASRAAGIKKFVYVSSVVVYGFHKRNGSNVIHESDGYGDDMGRYHYYAKSKLLADKLALDYHALYGFPVTVIRPGIIYGPMGGNVFNGSKIVFGQKNKLFPYVYVKNVVDAILVTTEKEEANGQAYNVVDTAPLTQRQFLKKIERILGAKKRAVCVPLVVTATSAKLLEYMSRRKDSEVSPPISMFTVDAIRRNLVFDTSKIREELGWAPAYSTDEGLKESFQWFNQQAPSR